MASTRLDFVTESWPLLDHFFFLLQKKESRFDSFYMIAVFFSFFLKHTNDLFVVSSPLDQQHLTSYFCSFQERLVRYVHSLKHVFRSNLVYLWFFFCDSHYVFESEVRIQGSVHDYLEPCIYIYIYIYIYI